MLTVVDNNDDSNETRNAAGAGRSLLDQIVRDGARQMLAAALQAEVADYVARYAGEVDEHGHRLVVRNGYHAEREVVTSAGAVAVKAPRVNDKRIDPDTGERKRFSSAILPAWARKSEQVSEVLPLLYLHGLSTSDFGPALEQFLGTGAGLSASSITRLTAQWQDEAKAFGTRDLSQVDYVYLWVDGIHLKVRLEQEKLCLLVMLGVRADGRKELVALAKARPGQLNFGSSGIASAAHLTTEVFANLVGIRIQHIPYKGGAPAVNAILTGQVQLNFAPIVSTALPHVKSGVLRALAVSTAQRWPSLPDVPSLAESGITGYDYASWVGMFAPAKTNAAIVNRLWNETSRAARGAEMKAILAQIGRAHV